MARGNYTVNFRQQGSKLQVTAKFSTNWVGFGIPRSVNEDEMPFADFVIGGGGSVYDKFLSAPQNTRPNTDKTGAFIKGTESVKTENGMTTLDFTRELAPTGRNSIDATKPFRILWAGGAVQGQGFTGIQYHQYNRGSMMVDLSTEGNCDAAARALFPQPAKGKAAKGKKGGKKAKAPCPSGKVRCTAALQGKGMNCILNLCVNAPAGQSSAPPAVAFPACPNRHVRCTAANQAQLKCVLNACTPDPTATGPCPPGQMACNAGLATAGKCRLGACVDLRLGADGH
jgi:hypothetical protein